MLGQSHHQAQPDLFKNLLAKQLNPQHPLYLLGQAIPWEKLEEAFAPLYGRVGLPSHPIRKMVALLVLKHLYNLSDERLVAMWQENPYYQYFAGEATFQWGQPCAASDLVHFRHRLGEKGIEKLFSLSIALHTDKLKKAKEVMVDTTVQEKNITFPTDAKLYKKVIKKCNTIAKSCGIKLRQSYRFVVQRLPRHAKKAKKALKKLRTLAPTLDQVAQWTCQRYARVLVGKGYRGHGAVGSSAVIIPGKKVHASAYALCRHKTLCKRRAAMEAIIGHFKSDHRLARNYLKGNIGDRNNALLAGMGVNLMLLLREFVGNFLATMFWALCWLGFRRKLRLSQNYQFSGAELLRLD